MGGKRDASGNTLPVGALGCPHHPCEYQGPLDYETAREQVKKKKKKEKDRMGPRSRGTHGCVIRFLGPG
jgi:hypothetical protein